MIFLGKVKHPVIHARILPADIVDVRPPQHQPDDVIAQDLEEFDQRREPEDERFERYPHDFPADRLDRSAIGSGRNEFLTHSCAAVLLSLLMVVTGGGW